jgi:hypothetical protein
MDIKNLEHFVIENYSFLLIGNLFQGILHNINGPLQTLTMQCDMCKIEYEKYIKDASVLMPEFKEKFRKKCDNFEKELNKLKDITSNIGFKRPESSKKPILISLMLKNCLKFWDADLFFKHQIKINLNLPVKEIYFISDEFKFIDIIDACIFLSIDSLKKAKEEGIDALSLDISFHLNQDNHNIKTLIIQNNAKNIEFDEFPSVFSLSSISGFIINYFSKDLGIKTEIIGNAFKIEF